MHKIWNMIKNIPGPKGLNEKGLRIPLNIFLM